MEQSESCGLANGLNGTLILQREKVLGSAETLECRSK